MVKTIIEIGVGPYNPRFKPRVINEVQAMVNRFNGLN